jgi:hypothetical protein
MVDESASSKSSTASSGYDIMEEARILFDFTQRPIPFLSDGIDDTTVVILATGLMEKFLRLSLISVFRRDAISKNMIAKVFEGKGPLSTFSAKIDVATGLGGILPDVRHDLSIVNKIRNEFAHSPIQLHLKDFDACLSLRLKAKFDVADQCKERKKFKESCLGILGSLATGTLLSIAADRFLSANTAGIMREYDSMMKATEADKESGE